MIQIKYPLFSVFEDTLKCLYLNGGCEQFCDGSGRRRTCKCAPGYALSEDRKSCIAQGVKILHCNQTFTRPELTNQLIKKFGNTHTPYKNIRPHLSMF